MSRALSFIAVITLLVAVAFASASDMMFRPDRFSSSNIHNKHHRQRQNRQQQQQHAVGAAPNLIFSRSTGAEVFTTPLVVGSNIFVGNGKGQLVNFHRTSGATNWTFTATVPTKKDDEQNRIYSQPTLAASNLALFVADSTGTLYNVDLASGSVDYKFDLNLDPVIAKPLIVGKSNVVVATYGGQVFNFNLTGDGSQVWNTSVGDFISADPLLVLKSDGTQLILVPAHDGNVHALDAATGKVVYKAASEGFNAISQTCIQDSARFVYCAVNGGEVFKMNSSTGDFVWKVRVSGSPAARPVFSADGSMIYFPTDFTQMVALSTQTGSATWRFDAKDFVLRTPAAVNPKNGNVIFGAETPFSSTTPGQPTLIAVDGTSGQQVWQTTVGKAGDSISTGVFVDASQIIVGSQQGDVFAFAN